MSDLIVGTIGPIMLIEMNRPPHNFFDEALIREVADVVDEADSNHEIRATVLAASGKSFCAGADFSSAGDPTPVEKRAATEALYGQGLRLFRSRKPIVAALHGAAIGGGLGLALAADFRVTCPSARLSANFTRIGFHPGFGLTVTLPDAVGITNAALMMLTGKRISGEEAYRMGLASVLAPDDGVREAALQLAEEISKSSPLGVMSTRATLRLGLAERVEKALARELNEQTWLRETHDFAEGVRATAERRPAVFLNR